MTRRSALLLLTLFALNALRFSFVAPTRLRRHYHYNDAALINSYMTEPQQQPSLNSNSPSILPTQSSNSPLFSPSLSSHSIPTSSQQQPHRSELDRLKAEEQLIQFQLKQIAALKVLRQQMKQQNDKESNEDETLTNDENEDVLKNEESMEFVERNGELFKSTSDSHDVESKASASHSTSPSSSDLLFDHSPNTIYLGHLSPYAATGSDNTRTGTAAAAWDSDWLFRAEQFELRRRYQSQPGISQKMLWLIVGSLVGVGLMVCCWFAIWNYREYREGIQSYGKTWEHSQQQPQQPSTHELETLVNNSAERQSNAQITAQAINASEHRKSLDTV